MLLAAAALLGRRAIIVFATLSVWTGLLMVYADQANWLLPYNVFVTPLQEWLADTIFYCYWDVVLSCVQ